MRTSWHADGAAVLQDDCGHAAHTHVQSCPGDTGKPASAAWFPGSRTQVYNLHSHLDTSSWALLITSFIQVYMRNKRCSVLPGSDLERKKHSCLKTYTLYKLSKKLALVPGLTPEIPQCLSCVQTESRTWASGWFFQDDTDLESSKVILLIYILFLVLTLHSWNNSAFRIISDNKCSLQFDILWPTLAPRTISPTNLFLNCWLCSTFFLTHFLPFGLWIATYIFFLRTSYFWFTVLP